VSTPRSSSGLGLVLLAVQTVDGKGPALVDSVGDRLVFVCGLAMLGREECHQGHARRGGEGVEATRAVGSARRVVREQGDACSAQAREVFRSQHVQAKPGLGRRRRDWSYGRVRADAGAGPRRGGGAAVAGCR
jgi:hypothetical protein